MAFNMDTNSIDIEKVFINHLEKKGIGQQNIDRFIKDLINSKFDDPNTSLHQVSSHLTLLGWEDTLIDYYTLQLAQAYLENSSAIS
ncbi:MAG: hypothetical protein PVG39_18975 [Desulfobacteraceae bacterium]|jgi:hypothetical protein